MKLYNFYKLVTIVTLLFFNTLIGVAKTNNSNNTFYRNFEENNGILTSQTLYRQDGKQLSQYIKYNYEYDTDNRLTENNILVWNSSKGKWENSISIRYNYNGNYTSTKYYKWDAKNNNYKLDPKFNTEFIDYSLQ